jgi:ribosomal protein L23
MSLTLLQTEKSYLLNSQGYQVFGIPSHLQIDKISLKQALQSLDLNPSKVRVVKNATKKKRRGKQYRFISQPRLVKYCISYTDKNMLPEDKLTELNTKLNLIKQ